MTTEEQNTCFAAWLHRHGAVLHHVVNGFAAGADRHDLMQEILLALWRAVPSFRGSAQASTFIYRVAHNTALTWKRSQRNYERRVAAVPIPVPDAASPPERDRETLELLYTVIRDFPAADRSLLLLHLDGLSYSAIAEIHGLSETNVGARLTRLRQTLVQRMKGVAHELR